MEKIIFLVMSMFFILSPIALASGGDGSQWIDQIAPLVKSGEIFADRHPAEKSTPMYMTFDVITKENQLNFMEYPLLFSKFRVLSYADEAGSTFGAISFIFPYSSDRPGSDSYFEYDLYIHSEDQERSQWVLLRPGGYDQLPQSRVSLSYALPMNAYHIFAYNGRIVIEAIPHSPYSHQPYSYTVPRDKLPAIRSLYSFFDSSLYSPAS